MLHLYHNCIPSLGNEQLYLTSSFSNSVARAFVVSDVGALFASEEGLAGVEDALSDAPAPFMAEALDDGFSSSSSQLSGTASDFSFSLFSFRLAFFLALLDKGLIPFDPEAAVLVGGGAHPIICPFGSAFESICACFVPRNRRTSSWGVNPGRILICFLNLERCGRCVMREAIRAVWGRGHGQEEVIHTFHLGASILGSRARGSEGRVQFQRQTSRDSKVGVTW